MFTATLAKVLTLPVLLLQLLPPLLPPLLPLLLPLVLLPPVSDEDTGRLQQCLSRPDPHKHAGASKVGLNCIGDTSRKTLNLGDPGYKP